MIMLKFYYGQMLIHGTIEPFVTKFALNRYSIMFPFWMSKIELHECIIAKRSTHTQKKKNQKHTSIHQQELKFSFFSLLILC